MDFRFILVGLCFCYSVLFLNFSSLMITIALFVALAFPNLLRWNPPPPLPKRSLRRPLPKINFPPPLPETNLSPSPLPETNLSPSPLPETNLSPPMPEPNPQPRMKLIAAYMLAYLGGNPSPSVSDIRNIISSVGSYASDESIQFFIDEMNRLGGDLAEILAAARQRLAGHGL